MVKISKGMPQRLLDRMIVNKIAFNLWFRDKHYSRSSSQANHRRWNIFETRLCKEILTTIPRSKILVLYSFMHKISKTGLNSGSTRMDAITPIKAAVLVDPQTISLALPSAKISKESLLHVNRTAQLVSILAARNEATHAITLMEETQTQLTSATRWVEVITRNQVVILTNRMTGLLI